MCKPPNVIFIIIIMFITIIVKVSYIGEPQGADGFEMEINLGK